MHLQPAGIFLGNGVRALLDTLSDLALKSLELGVTGSVERPGFSAGEGSHGEEGLRSGQRMQAQRREVHGAEIEAEDILV